MAATSRWNPSNWAAASSRAVVVRFSASRLAASFSSTPRKSPTRSRSRFNSLPRSSRAASLAASLSRSAAAEDQLLYPNAPHPEMHNAPSTTGRTTDRFCKPRNGVDVRSGSARQGPALRSGGDLTSSCGTRTEGVKAFASTEGRRSTSLPESGSRIFMAPTVRDSWIAKRLESGPPQPLC
jgi:hypothetical protein